MAIRFRFRNAREVHSVPVTGSGISLKDLKSAIISQRGLGDDRRPVDLLVFDARSRIQLVDKDAQVLRNSVLEVTLASAVASAAPLGNAANTTAIQQAAGASRGPRLFGSRGKGIRAGDNVVREDTSHADALLGKEELAAATGGDEATGGYERLRLPS
ncbi:hypothetical protein FNF29_02425 [Cafeteria roenbergensis]|uniref:DWNN domain-containing protein n=1 Tax=Cafeteria roenbergensis TaxID=33653 RepID=A0A5A8CPB7_CAFRO|nr:hypothetical protein FNF29_02425 [Cafeteria roenbergensis]|eukprot:KAA0154548.1 hypothetical protein FNF29_02425 [Cafeteria roenbergensis]